MSTIVSRLSAAVDVHGHPDLGRSLVFEGFTGVTGKLRALDKNVARRLLLRLATGFSDSPSPTHPIFVHRSEFRCFVTPVFEPSKIDVETFAKRPRHGQAAVLPDRRQ